ELGLPFARAVHPPGRDNRLGLEGRAPGIEQPDPYVAAPVRRVDALGTSGLAELQPVHRDETMRRDHVVRGQLDRALQVEVLEARVEPILAELHVVADRLRVPGTGGDEPGPARPRRAVGEARVDGAGLDPTLGLAMRLRGRQADE